MKPQKPSHSLHLGVSMPAHIDFCRRILRGVSNFCSASGIPLNLISDTGSVRPFKPTETLRIPPLLGTVAHISKQEEFAVYRALNPCVVGTSNRVAPSGPSVINDDLAIGKLGAQYLASRGLKSLFFINRSIMHFSTQRASGFIEAARALGLQAECIDFARSSELAAIASHLLTLPAPMGVLTDSDLSARVLIESIPHSQSVVPNKIAILGIDDDSLQNSLSPIGLSSIRTGGHEIGYRAAELLMRLHHGETPPATPVLVRPTRVIERASTNAFAVTDPLVVQALQYLREHIATIRDVNDLVRALKVNRRTMELRFRKALNRSITTELTEARLQRARQLLESTELTIAEIAELVGYPEYRLLTLAFQRLTGEPPTAYRKRARME